jgi:hypothetical protein
VIAFAYIQTREANGNAGSVLNCRATNSCTDAEPLHQAKESAPPDDRLRAAGKRHDETNNFCARRTAGSTMQAAQEPLSGFRHSEPGNCGFATSCVASGSRMLNSRGVEKGGPPFPQLRSYFPSNVLLPPDDGTGRRPALPLRMLFYWPAAPRVVRGPGPPRCGSVKDSDNKICRGTQTRQGLGWLLRVPGIVTKKPTAWRRNDPPGEEPKDFH